MTQDEFRAQFTSGHIGDQGDYKARLNKISDYVFGNCLKDGGVDTVANINAMTDVTDKLVIKVSDTGTLTDGSLSVGSANTSVVYVLGTGWKNL